jgi:chorismate synthase
VLESLGPVEIVAWVAEVRGLPSEVDPATVTHAEVDATDVRCPDRAAAARFDAVIREARASGDTVGGVIGCVARGVPAGLGDPVFDKLDADLAKALISLPAAKAFSCGSGFEGTRALGSAHNDLFAADPDGTVTTRTNRSGGIQGGISNGMPIEVAVGFKPVATVAQGQPTVTDQGEAVVLAAKGRHDPCVLPRAVPIVEAMVALVLADHWLRWRGQVARTSR